MGRIKMRHYFRMGDAEMDKLNIDDFVEKYAEVEALEQELYKLNKYATLEAIGMAFGND